MDLPLLLIGWALFLFALVLLGVVADSWERRERQARREEPPYVKVPSYWGKPR